MADDLHGSIREHLHQQRLEAEAAAAQSAAHDPNDLLLFRLVHDLVPTSADFRANLAKCLPRRGPEIKDPLIWAGLSMYDNAAQAESTARRFNGRHGSFLAEVYLPPNDLRVFIRQTLTPGHFTVVCCESLCPTSFIGTVRPIVGLNP
jgi:hypothetical protein